MAVHKCLDGKYKRNDTVKYLSTASGLTENQIRCIQHRYGKGAMYPIVRFVIKEIKEELENENVHFPKIWYKEKVDSSSGKVRMIGIQNIKQQLYDYIAIEALEPLLRRVGEYQVASIKGRGTLRGMKTVSRWIRNKSMKYYVKLDVTKCFESIDRDKLMDFISAHVKNEKLIYLIRTLIFSFEKGLSIGSYLSQHLCNLYISIIYHCIMEGLYKMRRGNRVRLVHHCLIYMDDILLIGSNRSDLKKSIKFIVKKAGEMGLEIKRNYQVKEIGKHCIDMMGYKIYRDHVGIRSRIFLRTRRNFSKARKHITFIVSQKCISYYGYLKHTNSKRIIKRWKAKSVIRKSKGVIRNESKICRAAAAN